METDNIILEHLRAIRGVLDRHSDELREIKECIGIVETGLAGVAGQVAGLAGQYASLSNRMDRLDERVGRIERRLGLLDA